MREILFRGRNENSTWIYGSLLVDKDTFDKNAFIYYICDIDGYSMEIVNTKTIGQFTGLTDKNGTKIFEGDILRLCGDGYDWNGIVVFGRTTSDEDNFEDYGYGWQIDKITKDEPVYTKILLWVEAEADGIDCEIIGNIHDNSELLNK